MLKQLSYSVQFPSTGRTFKNQIVFEPGLTAIVGSNEAGKSLVVEMIGYCLFGKAALRGAAGDYKNLSVELILNVKGQDICVRRAPKNETLLVGDQIHAVGAEAINRTVPQLLGFGLDVFNIALVAQQDELHALTKMKPTERSKMVEKLTGEVTLAVTEKDCKDESKAHVNTADAMAMMVSQPVVPVKPEGYMPSDALQVAYRALEARNLVRHRLSLVSRPELPVEPVAPDLDMGEGELHDYQIMRDRLRQDQMYLERQIAAIPEPRFTLEEIEKAEEYDEYLRDKAGRGPRPNHSLSDLREWEKAWLTPASGECPKCGYNLAEHTVEKPPLALAQVRQQLAMHARWEGAPTPRRREIDISDPSKERTAHERATERKSLRHQLAQITVPVDRAAELELARDYNRQRLRYDERMQRYDQDLGAWEEAQATLQTLGETESSEASHQAWTDSLRYEQALITYADACTTYAEKMEQITTERELGEAFKRGADALKLTRQKVKQELTPSLSREASKLLHVMTNGERSEIIIDEDFNVFVDNQPLSTLSGSGKSVVNLALRIGLGRVLTSRILPIFIGDEIDYAMDKDRVGATQQMFRSLSSVLAQVILVTHKDIEADNIIALK